jgi:hypothetical protein
MGSTCILQRDVSTHPFELAVWLAEDCIRIQRFPQVLCSNRHQPNILSTHAVVLMCHMQPVGLCLLGSHAVTNMWLCVSVCAPAAGRPTAWRACPL